MKEFRKCKVGMFIHHVFPGVHYADGTKVQSLDEMADAFDAEGFADSLARMGVEYIVYTAWHFAVRPLYPSAVSEKWRPGNCPKRDLLGDIIDSVRARGIHVIFYTHPRDGHDFSEEDKEKTGWGRGGHPTDDQQPDLGNFNYERWNEYMKELYTELADRYASRLTGYYTDSAGPKDPQGCIDPPKDHQVVDYLMIRNIMKSRNPDLVTFQNYYGHVYTQDWGNSETYTGYIGSVFGGKNAEKWHCTSRVATTLVPFGTWTAGPSVNAAPVLTMEPEGILRYTLFNGSASACGNVLFASGTFAEGNVWSPGVEETIAGVTRELSRFGESFMDALPSRSYPTFPGSTLEDNGFRFWMTDGDGKYEYLHCLRLPEDGVLAWGAPEDGIVLEDPVPLTGEAAVTAFERTADGYRMTVSGTPDKTDTVFRFRRTGETKKPGYEWINNTDKRMCWGGTWRSNSDMIYDKRTAAGCYEREVHCATAEGSSLYVAYEGSVLELYGVLDDGYGAADVYIDGIYCATVDEQSSERKAHALLYRSLDLYGGRHAFQLYTKDGRFFTVDAVKIIK